MSIWESVAWSGMRAVAVAMLAWCGARPLVRELRVRPRVVVAALVFLLAGLLLTPVLVLAYAWSGLLAFLPVASASLHVVHALLLAGKLLPVAVAVLYLAPAPPLSGPARHCLVLLPHGSSAAARVRGWWWHLAWGPGRRHLLCLAAVFLLAFQEFELASLLALPAWTVWLFDAQAVGASLPLLLWNTLSPGMVEGLVIAAGLWLLSGSRGLGGDGMTGGGRDTSMVTSSAARTALTWTVLAAAFAAGVLVPLACAFQDIATGLRRILTDGGLLHELLVSMAFAAVATAAAMMVSRWALRLAPRHAWLLVLCCLPGLSGSLVLGLSLQALFQVPGLSAAYDTPLPLLIALTLLLLPVAVLLRAILANPVANQRSHCAELLRRSPVDRQRRSGRRILAAVLGRGRLLAALVLFTWAYFEVVASALLAPVHMTPASVRLYNLMHYGQSAVLSGMLTLMVLGLAVPVAAGFWTNRFRNRRVVHG